MRRLLLIASLAACGSSSSPPPPGPASGGSGSAVAPPVDAAVAAKPPEVDAATAASPQKSEGPALVIAEGATRVDGAVLRARHKARLAADASPVTVLTGGTALELGKRLCEASVPKRPPATPVLVKPNMSGFNWFKDPRTHHGDNGVTGRTTDPEFVRGIIQCLKARGHAKITIADGFTGKASDWDRLIDITGYKAMTAAEGVELVALDDDGVFDKKGDTPGKPLAITGMDKTRVPTLLMPKLLAEHLEHGLYISAPKIKTHRYAVFSVGIKGMQGTTMYSDASPAFEQKWRSHREIEHALALVKKKAPDARAVYVQSLEVFAERMADVLEVETPDVVLAEGAPAQLGDGFDKLYATPEPVAIGGTNVVLVDRVAAQYLGMWNNDALGAELAGHKTSPLLEVAAKRFGVDITNPRLAGDGAALLAQPRPGYLIGMADFVVGKAPADDAGEELPLADAASLPKELHAVAVARPPAIDGTIDEAWAAAKPLAFATDWAGHTTKTATKVRALWSASGLYLLFELDGIVPNTDTGRPIDKERVDLYEENCVELFLVPDPANLGRYFEVEVGPFGHYFDLLVDKAKKPKSNAAWSSGLRVGTARDDAAHHAIIEVALEGPDVVAALRPGALPLGVYRMEGKAHRQYLAAFPTRTPRPNFHVPEAFGKLVLDP